MPRPLALAVAATLALATAPALALAHPGEHPQAAAPTAPPAPPEAVRAVDAFHAALRNGDTASALAQLADDVLIFEAGGAERSKSEYAAAHLSGDAAFARAVPSTLLRRTGGVTGGLAWVASEGRTQGRYKERDVDRLTTETMLLRRDGASWKIVHVHWSSRAAAAAH